MASISIMVPPLVAFRAKMTPSDYILSFTTGSLFHRDSISVAEIFLDLKEWGLVKEKVATENILQSRTQSTLKRVCREIIQRLEMLEIDELQFLVETSHKEQAYLLWLAVCRRYKFIGEFAVEVIRENYLSLRTELKLDDFEAFYAKKSEFHPELEKMSDSSRLKLRQVTFRMLREADILTEYNMINAAMLSPALVDVISRRHRQDLRFFPIFESELKGMSA